MQGQSPWKKATHVAIFIELSSSTRITGCWCIQRRETARRCISHNESAGTYTLVYEHCDDGVSGMRDRTDRVVGVASVMLQVQCISLPKRFVPSVSKCPSVVCPALVSPFLSFSHSHSLPICMISVPPDFSHSRYTVWLARTHPRGKRRANATPGAHAHVN